MNPFFTMIIPCYNSGGTIYHSIESILCQNYPDFEILIIDGASSDKTLEIIMAFNDSRIRIYSEPDTGIYDAMNKGIHYARGEWIYFLGSDDRLHDRDVLMDVYRCASGLKRHVIYGNVLTHGDTRWAKDQEIYGGPFTLQRLLRRNICHQSIFYRRSFIQQHHLQFDLRYPVSADWDFNIQCRLQTRFKYLRRIVAHFSSGGASSQKTFTDTFWSDINLNYASLYRSSNFHPIFWPVKVVYSNIKRQFKGAS